MFFQQPIFCGQCTYSQIGIGKHLGISIAGPRPFMNLMPFLCPLKVDIASEVNNLNKHVVIVIMRVC